MLQLEKKGIQGALVDGQNVAADLFDAARDAKAVEGPEQIKGFEDHQGQGSLRNVGFFGHYGEHLLVSNMNMPHYLLESNRNVPICRGAVAEREIAISGPSNQCPL